MLLAAIADPDPVIVFEHKLLYKMKGQVPEGYYTVPIGKAEIRREGTRPHHRRHRRSWCIARSTPPKTLAGEGIEAEVIDLRTIRPLDTRDDHRQRQEDRHGCSASTRA